MRNLLKSVIYLHHITFLCWHLDLKMFIEEIYRLNYKKSEKIFLMFFFRLSPITSNHNLHCLPSRLIFCCIYDYTVNRLWKRKAQSVNSCRTRIFYKNKMNYERHRRVHDQSRLGPSGSNKTPLNPKFQLSYDSWFGSFNLGCSSVSVIVMLRIFFWK